ncbi:MAG: SDR family oxidoreductase [Bacteroidetes bacterium]|nr:SDR family oxidoreductase [Bacteroidota bacterium]
MKNYLIVGASSGIGKALTERLALAGSVVWGTFHSTPPEPHSGIEYHHLNVLDDNISLDFLPDSLDGVAYCPGSITLKPFHRIPPADFVNDYQLQVIGAVKVLQSVLPRLKRAPNASIVLFSTVAVQTGFNYHSMVSASKGGIEGLTKALAAEFAPAIRVNCIAPSITDTRLASSLLNTDDKRQSNTQRHPLKRVGAADDIASAAEFLLTDRSSWMTGQIVHIDGGISTLKV